MSYVWTDDPDDPCPYCVAWEEPEGWDQATDPTGFQLIPVGVEGEPVTRMCRMPHPECEQAVLDYVEEVSEWG